jgi:hypothetical protein
MKEKDLVKFKECLEDGDEDAVMVILEDRDDRVLVSDLRFKDWTIMPTSVYQKDELMAI